MDIHGGNLIRHKTKNLSQELSELSHRLRGDFQGFPVSITNDDIESSGKTWVIKEGKKIMLVQRYATFLEAEIAQSRLEIANFEREIRELERKLGAIRVPTKPARKEIEGSYYQAQRDWIAVKDFPSHPQYKTLGAAYMDSLGTVNDLTRLIQERRQLETRKAILENNLNLYLEDLGYLDTERLLESFCCTLDAVSIPQHEEIRRTRGNRETPIVSTSRRFSLAAVAILLGATIGFVGKIGLSGKSPGSISAASVPESISRGSGVEKVVFLLGLNKASIATALEQLAQNGDLKLFNTNIKDALRDNFRKVTGREDPGKFDDTPEENDYCTYKSLLDGQIELRNGVSRTQIESAMAKYLAHLMREKGIEKSIESTISPLLLAAQSGHNASNIDTVIRTTLMSYMAELSSYISADGCIVDTLATELIFQKGIGGGTTLSIHYAIVGLPGNFAVEIPLNN